jgi:hypothetical protein
VFLELRATEEFKAPVRVTKDHRDTLVHRAFRVQGVLKAFLETRAKLDTKVYRVI